MKKYTTPALILITVLLAGCRLDDSTENPPANQKFVGYVSGDSFFRLNTVDGTLYSHKEGKLIPVPSERLKLTVGQLYTDENDKTMLYEGNGAFTYSKGKITESLLEKYK